MTWLIDKKFRIGRANRAPTRGSGPPDGSIALRPVPFNIGQLDSLTEAAKLPNPALSLTWVPGPKLG